MPKIAIDICIRMYHKGIFLRASVGSWLFDGIEEPLLNLASQLHTLSLDIPYDKFGWFYQVRKHF